MKGGKPLGVAHVAIPVTRKMEAALDNLALAATSVKQLYRSSRQQTLLSRQR
jgi:hypothetical protein